MDVGSGTSSNPTVKPPLPKPVNKPVSQPQNTNYNSGIALRDTSRTPSVRTEAVMFDDGGDAGENSDDDDIGDKAAVTDNDSLQGDETEEVTGKAESSNVGTETKIETGDRNSNKTLKDFLSDINYFHLYNDVVDSTTEELFSRAGGRYLEMVKAAPRTSSKVVTNLLDETVKTGVEYVGDAFETMVKSLSGLELITKGAGFISTGIEFSIEMNEGVSEGKSLSESFTDSIIILGTSTIASFLASEITAAFLTFLSINSPMAVIVLPVLVATIFSTHVGNVVENKLDEDIKQSDVNNNYIVDPQNY